MFTTKDRNFVSKELVLLQRSCIFSVDSTNANTDVAKYNKILKKWDISILGTSGAGNGRGLSYAGQWVHGYVAFC